MAVKAETLRMCVVCRKRFFKPLLLRHVMLPSATKDSGLVPDETGTMPGRGWYLCQDPQCRKRFAMMKFRSKARNGSKVHG